MHRAASLRQYVGGKGQGIALALQRWAPSETSVVASFMGGDTGRFCELALQEAGLELLTQRAAAPTRICTTLLAPPAAPLAAPMGEGPQSARA